MWWDQEPDLTALREGRALFRVSPVEGEKVLEGLASRGSSMSMLYLGDYYDRGELVPKDADKALNYYKRAIDNGSVPATIYLASVLLRACRYDEARRCLEYGSSRNYAPALYRLGWMQLKGFDRQPSVTEARNSWERAYALGHLRARRNLAFLYAKGGAGLFNIPLGVFMIAQLPFQLIRKLKEDPEKEFMR